MYSLEMNVSTQDIVAQAKRTGQEIPDRILNAPELHIGLEFYLEAFFDLDSERSLGYGAAGRIPWSAVSNYAKHHNLDEESTGELFYFVRAMDSANMKRIQDDSKSKGK